MSLDHEVQRLMLERLGIAWPPGEPFYALVEGEILRLRDEGLRLAADYATSTTLLEQEVARLTRLLNDCMERRGYCPE